MTSMKKKATRAVAEKRELVQQFMAEKILRGATKVFGRAGYRGATVEEIAREAEVSVGTVYQYFKDKYDLYIKVLNHFLDRLIESVRQADGGLEDPQLRLEKVVANHIEFFEDNPEFFRLYLIGKHDWIIDPIDRPKTDLLERYRRYINIISEAINALVDSNIFIEIDSVNVAYYMSELAYSVVFQRVSGYSRGTRKEDTKMIINLFMEGLKKRKKKN